MSGREGRAITVNGVLGLFFYSSGVIYFHPNESSDYERRVTHELLSLYACRRIIYCIRITMSRKTRGTY